MTKTRLEAFTDGVIAIIHHHHGSGNQSAEATPRQTNRDSNSLRTDGRSMSFFNNLLD